MARELSAYEVRCPRCDVSFPVGTKRCMHCGGPTGGHSRPQLLESAFPTDYATDERLPDATAGPGTGRFELPEAGPIEEEPEDFDQPASVGRTLFRSFGGLIWVVVLIVFSIARHCGGQ